MAFSPFISVARRMRNASADSAAVFLRDVGHGLLEVSHNTLALVGLMLAAVLLFAAGRADVRHDAEVWTLGWLQARQEARELWNGSDPPEHDDHEKTHEDTGERERQ